MSNPVFWGKNKKNIIIVIAELAQRVVKVCTLYTHMQHLWKYSVSPFSKPWKGCSYLVWLALVAQSDACQTGDQEGWLGHKTLTQLFSTSENTGSADQINE